MNVFDTIHAVRPEVDPMPLDKRRMIRESLFGIGHEDAARSFGARSESGAVVSTAPHGTRVSLRRRPRVMGSIVKMVAGIVAVGAIGAIGAIVWAMLSSDDGAVVPDASVPPSVATTVGSTAPPSTGAPFVRTGVSRSAPLILPPSLLGVDEVAITPPILGSSTMLLTAPDGSLLWMAEFDGEPTGTDGLDVRQIGSVGIGVPRGSEAPAVSYQLLTPCGLVVLNDAPGAPLDRPEIVSLFESMSLDGNATIDVSLPPGFSVFDIGQAQTGFTAQFQVPVFTETRAARLVQIPDGSISQLMFGGRQLAPATFLGGPAYVDAAPNDPALVSVYWQDGPTVFNVSSSELTYEDLESFVGTLEPATPDDWTIRFDAPVPEATASTSSCMPQPSFGPTLNP